MTRADPVGRVESTERCGANQVHERLRFLSEASALLAESLDLDITLHRVTSLAVPRLGDWCVIHVLEEEGIRLAAVTHQDPLLEELLREAHDRYPTSIDARGGVGAVIRTGQTMRHRGVTDEVLTAIARDVTHLDMLRRLRFGDVLTVPLAARGNRLGALSVGTTDERMLLAADVETIEELGRRSALAIDNARLHSALQAAHDALAFQAALLQTQTEADMQGQLVVSPSGRMISFNSRFAEMWSIPEDVLERGSDDEALAVAFGSVADPEAFLARVRDIYADPRPSRDEIHLRNGRVFERFGAALTSGESYLGYAWYFRDVTDQKRAEQQLVEAGERFAALARTLQQSLLPPALPELPGFDVAASYYPAGKGDDVGGDFYDVFHTAQGTWSVVVGDVCGKGAAAAAVTALVRYTSRAVAVQTASPAKALALLNDALLRQGGEEDSERFVTIVQARLKLRPSAAVVTLACAGHPLPLLRRASGKIEAVGACGTLLGALPAIDVRDVQVSLSSGDALVFITDGVIEARDGNEQFGQERLRELLTATAGFDASEICSRIAQAALSFSKNEVADDIAVLVLARR